MRFQWWSQCLRVLHGVSSFNLLLHIASWIWTGLGKVQGTPTVAFQWTFLARLADRTSCIAWVPWASEGPRKDMEPTLREVFTVHLPVHYSKLGYLLSLSLSVPLWLLILIFSPSLLWMGSIGVALQTVMFSITIWNASSTQVFFFRIPQTMLKKHNKAHLEPRWCGSPALSQKKWRKNERLCFSSQSLPQLTLESAPSRLSPVTILSTIYLHQAHLMVGEQEIDCSPASRAILKSLVLMELNIMEPYGIPYGTVEAIYPSG